MSDFDRRRMIDVLYVIRLSNEISYITKENTYKLCADDSNEYIHLEMKFFVALLLIGVSIIVRANDNQIWGILDGKFHCRIYSGYGNLTFTFKSSTQVFSNPAFPKSLNEHFFFLAIHKITYSSGTESGDETEENTPPMIINGFKHTDYADPPSTVNILAGGVACSFVTINLLAAPSHRTRSYFEFYLIPHQIAVSNNVCLKDFIEMEIYPNVD